VRPTSKPSARSCDLRSEAMLKGASSGTSERPDYYIPELALVALADDRIVGHVMVSHTDLETEGCGSGSRCCLRSRCIRAKQGKASAAGSS